MSYHSATAIVLGLDANGYGVTRSLAGAGIRVVALWDGSASYGRHSRLCEAVAIRSPEAAFDEVERQARRLAVRDGATPVLFPTSDRFAALIAAHRDDLQRVARFHWVAPALLEQVADKARVRATCQRLGILVPRTEAPETGSDVDTAARSMRFPTLLKPADGLRTRLPGGMKNIVIESPVALREWYAAQPELLGRTVCQEIIPGGDDHMYEYIGLATREGSIDVEASMRKIRQYLPGYGITSFGRTERCTDVLMAGRILLEGVGWLGLASLEFKRSATDGRHYFIELNPRLPWYNHLLADAGVNFPVLAYRDLIGLPLPKPSPAQRDNVHWLNLELDVGAFWRLNQAGQLGVGAWLRSLLRARSFAWFNPTDPAPMLAVLARLAGIAVRRLLGR